MGVKLRKRKLPSGKTQLYLDVYRHGSRRFEALGFMLDGDRFHNRETLKMAETIRAKRELDLQSEIHGITGTHNRKSSFINSAQVYLARIKTALHQAVKDNLIPTNHARELSVFKRLQDGFNFSRTIQTCSTQKRQSSIRSQSLSMSI
jgi:hypothetical protein